MCQDFFFHSAYKLNGENSELFKGVREHAPWEKNWKMMQFGAF